MRFENCLLSIFIIYFLEFMLQALYVLFRIVQIIVTYNSGSGSTVTSL